MTKNKQAEANAQGCGCLLIIAIIISAVAVYGVNPPESGAPPAITSEPSIPVYLLSATPYPLQADYLALPDVLSAMVSPAQTDDGWNIYSEVIVAPGANTEATADTLLRAALARYGAFVEFSVILDDCSRAVDYIFDNETDTWRLAELSVTACGATAQQLNTPVISTSLPTRTPRPTVTARPTTDPRPMRPGNCSTAVAMGISAQQAAQWSHLDRDNDGVACYGD
ncbi:MAG: excalibur calcium-binding domain-containing protein [Aggregatilineales bacterium]